MKRESGNWTRYREQFPGVEEIDFHHEGRRQIPYWEAMEQVYSQALHALEEAYDRGVPYVMFQHGWSTSRLGKTTARSVIRGLMRSPVATPYILRNQCPPSASASTSSKRATTASGTPTSAP